MLLFSHNFSGLMNVTCKLYDCRETELVIGGPAQQAGHELAVCPCSRSQTVSQAAEYEECLREPGEEKPQQGFLINVYKYLNKGYTKDRSLFSVVK